MNRLEGKVAIVTGAASGLGRADAEALCRAGAQVLLTDVNTNAGQDVAAALGAVRPGCAAFATQDVRDEERWTEVVAEARRRFGGLHVLVNNAGVMVAATPETTTLEQFRFANSVMSEGVFLGCRAAIPVINASGGGSIINMSSVASHLGYPVFFAYSAAKGAVRAMTKSIALHCQMNKYRIRCNSVHPGAIETPMLAAANEVFGMKMADYEAAPWGLGKPEDVANLVVFLASDESRYINGAEILIDNALAIQ
ncbi:MAG: SDR family oxidoreductase [Steroidobacteraceae bacterium]